MKTLKELSKETGISVEMIEQIERGIDNMKSGNVGELDLHRRRLIKEAGVSYEDQDLIDQLRIQNIAYYRESADYIESDYKLDIPSTLKEFYESLEWFDVTKDTELVAGMVVKYISEYMTVRIDICGDFVINEFGNNKFQSGCGTCVIHSVKYLKYAYLNPLMKDLK